MSDAPLILYRAAAVRDALHIDVRPGCVMVRDHLIVAVGDETMVRRAAGTPDRVIDLGDVLLMPGMVNAHAHLDLTHQPRVPFAGNFIDWLKGVIQSRVADEQSITAAVHEGLSLSRDSGVNLIADIAGSLTAVKARLAACAPDNLAGISFLEVVGMGTKGSIAAQQARDHLTTLAPPHPSAAQILALEPHAPYSTGLPAYQFAADHFPIASTHLAETLEEAQFIREATGPFADLLKRLGKWDDSIKPHHISPVQHLAPILAQQQCRWIIAHCNHVDDADISTLAEAKVSIAYCPVASNFFHHRHHRYRDMLSAGINVCLGTDSIICQPVDELQPLGILPQMRHLYQRDRTSPQLLLQMATIYGAIATAAQRRCQLAAGEPANMLAVRFDPHDATDPLVQILCNRAPGVRVG